LTLNTTPVHNSANRTETRSGGVIIGRATESSTEEIEQGRVRYNGVRVMASVSWYMFSWCNGGLFPASCRSVEGQTEGV